MFTSAILTAVWAWIVAQFMAFWPWIIGVAGAILAFLFSPEIRKYTIAAIALGAIVLGAFIWGYTSNHSITVHNCTEYAKYLKEGPTTTNLIKVFKRNGLCE